MKHSCLDEPELRFPTFSDNWSQKQMKDICVVSQGLQIPISERFAEDGENRYFYITNEFLKENAEKEYFIENPPKSVICTENDVLMTRTGNTGKVITNVNGVFHNNFFKIDYDDSIIDKDFLCYFLNNFNTQKMIMRLAGTSTIPDLNHKDFYSIKINYPSLPEQRKISDFLKKIDKKIDLLEQKHKHYKDFKNYSMQQIFTQKLRFKDANGDYYNNWEKILLKDADIIISDGNYGEAYPKEKDFTNEGVPFIRVVNIQNSKLTFEDMRYISPSLHSKLLQGHLNENDILISTRGDIGLIAYVTKEFANSNINAQLCLLRVNDENICPKYLFYFLSTPFSQRQLLQFQTGSALKQLPKNNLKYLKLIIPPYEEQKKIVDFLVEIDKSIGLIEENILKFNQFKKGLLQKMFL